MIKIRSFEDPVVGWGVLNDGMDGVIAFDWHHGGGRDK